MSVDLSEAFVLSRCAQLTSFQQPRNSISYASTMDSSLTKMCVNVTRLLEGQISH